MENTATKRLSTLAPFSILMTTMGLAFYLRCNKLIITNKCNEQ